MKNINELIVHINKTKEPEPVVEEKTEEIV